MSENQTETYRAAVQKLPCLTLAQFASRSSELESSWFRPLPVRIIIERKYFLYAFRPAAAMVGEDFQSFANSCHARVGVCCAGVTAATDAVEDGGDFEDFAAGFEEIG